MYFKQLPMALYSVEGVQKLVTNILTRITISNELKQNIFLFEEYSIKDGETPESVAFDNYGSTQYHWVILICNEIIYPWNDWALPQSVLIDVVKDRYGASNLYTTHHYIDDDGYVTSQTVGTYPVSNLEYETGLNDEKRNIKILNVNFLTAFVNEFDALTKLV